MLSEIRFTDAENSADEQVIWFVLLRDPNNQINKTNQTNQINQSDRSSHRPTVSGNIPILPSVSR